LSDVSSFLLFLTLQGHLNSFIFVWTGLFGGKVYSTYLLNDWINIETYNIDKI